MSRIKGALGLAAGATATTGIGMNVAGIYAITNATTGAAMLGSTAAGTSAAGTAGIMAGTSGLIGAVGSVVLMPATIAVSIGFAAMIGYVAYKKHKAK